MAFHFGEPVGQEWTQFGELAIALVLSALIGLEREYRQKSAGLRTYTVVGVAAALMMLVSKYGFTDVLQADKIVLDPSRVAAQIVTGIGFIGGGVIFMRRDVVRGLTTAAIMWLTAAVGMACGAGLPVLAIAVTGAHFVIVFGFPYVADLLPRPPHHAVQIRMIYEAQRGVLRKAVMLCTREGFSVSDVSVDGPADEGDDVISVGLAVQGRGDVELLAERIRAIEGAISVHLSEPSDPAETA